MVAVGTEVGLLAAVEVHAECAHEQVVGELGGQGDSC
jgi:hypothetical protein